MAHHILHAAIILLCFASSSCLVAIALLNLKVFPPDATYRVGKSKEEFDVFIWKTCESALRDSCKRTSFFSLGHHISAGFARVFVFLFTASVSYDALLTWATISALSKQESKHPTSSEDETLQTDNRIVYHYKKPYFHLLLCIARAILAVTTLGFFFKVSISLGQLSNTGRGLIALLVGSAFCNVCLLCSWFKHVYIVQKTSKQNERSVGSGDGGDGEEDDRKPILRFPMQDRSGLR